MCRALSTSDQRLSWLSQMVGMIGETWTLSGVSLNPMKGAHCFLKKETSSSLLTVSLGPYCRLSFLLNKLPHLIKTKYKWLMLQCNLLFSYPFCYETKQIKLFLVYRFVFTFPKIFLYEVYYILDIFCKNFMCAFCLLGQGFVNSSNWQNNYKSIQ